MYKYMIGLTFLLASTTASADIIKCTFTEPFYSTQYSMVQQSLTVEDFEGKKKVLKNVSFQIMGPGQFELWDKDNNVLQVLTLSFDGSDGMSDYVYPYEVQSTEKVYPIGANYGIGACTSNFLHEEMR